WFAIEQLRCFQHFDDGFFCGEDGLTCKLGIVFDPALGGDPFWSFASKPTVATDQRASWQLQFAPPGDVVLVTECTYHGDTSALIGLCQFMRVDLHCNVK